jgi:site-specific recombinase XerD
MQTNTPYLEAFLTSKAKKSKKTASTYRTAVNSWIEWSAEHKLDPMTTDALTGFHGYLVENRTATTTKTYMAGVCSYLEFLAVMNHDMSGMNMSRVHYEVKNGPQVYSYAKVVHLDELRKEYMPNLVAWFENYPLPEKNSAYNVRLSALRNVAIFWTLYETAARIGEVQRLDRSQIDQSSMVAIVTGKGNRPHTLRFGVPGNRAIPAIMNYVKERRDTSAALFVSHARNSNGRRLSLTSLHSVIKEEMTLAGVHDDLTPHDIRHYRAAAMLKQDVPLHVIQQFLNHRDIGTTRNFYAPITDEEDMQRHLSAIIS